MHEFTPNVRAVPVVMRSISILDKIHFHASVQLKAYASLKCRFKVLNESEVVHRFYALSLCTGLIFTQYTHREDMCQMTLMPLEKYLVIFASDNSAFC